MRLASLIGYVLLSRVDRVDQRVKRLTSVFYLLFAVGAASIFAGIVGSILLGPLFYDPAAVSSFRYWFSVELLNQLAFLPMILSYPEGRKWERRLLPQPTFRLPNDVLVQHRFHRVVSERAALTAELACNAPSTETEAMVARASSGVMSWEMLARLRTLMCSISPARCTASRSSRL